MADGHQLHSFSFVSFELFVVSFCPIRRIRGSGELGRAVIRGFFLISVAIRSREG